MTKSKPTKYTRTLREMKPIILIEKVNIYGSTISEYEKKRMRQIEENKKILDTLGIKSEEVKKLTIKKKAPTSQSRSVRASTIEKRPTRYSLRNREKLSEMKEETRIKLEKYSIEEKEKIRSLKYPMWTKGNVFGHIPHIPIGAEWEFRIDCGRNGVHRSVVGGIHGSATEGCYSLALSGGYEDDIDEGDRFIYTGSGGRDLKGTKNNPKNLRTAPQSKDQVFEGYNLSLKISFETEKPIRVIRGYKLNSPYAPKEGYRYDGLYKVTRYWSERGRSGFKVCRFELNRLPNQPPLIPNQN